MIDSSSSLSYEDHELLSKDEIPGSAKLIVLSSIKISICFTAIVMVNVWMWGVVIHVLGSDLMTLSAEDIENFTFPDQEKLFENITQALLIQNNENSGKIFENWLDVLTHNNGNPNDNGSQEMRLIDFGETLATFYSLSISSAYAFVDLPDEGVKIITVVAFIGIPERLMFILMITSVSYTLSGMLTILLNYLHIKKDSILAANKRNPLKALFPKHRTVKPFQQIRWKPQSVSNRNEKITRQALKRIIGKHYRNAHYIENIVKKHSITKTIIEYYRKIPGAKRDDSFISLYIANMSGRNCSKNNEDRPAQSTTVNNRHNKLAQSTPDPRNLIFPSHTTKRKCVISQNQETQKSQSVLESITEPSYNKDPLTTYEQLVPSKRRSYSINDNAHSLTSKACKACADIKRPKRNYKCSKDQTYDKQTERTSAKTPITRQGNLFQRGCEGAKHRDSFLKSCSRVSACDNEDCTKRDYNCPNFNSDCIILSHNSDYKPLVREPLSLPSTFVGSKVHNQRFMTCSQAKTGRCPNTKLSGTSISDPCCPTNVDHRRRKRRVFDKSIPYTRNLQLRTSRMNNLSSSVEMANHLPSTRDNTTTSLIDNGEDRRRLGSSCQVDRSYDDKHTCEQYHATLSHGNNRGQICLDSNKDCRHIASELVKIPSANETNRKRNHNVLLRENRCSLMCEFNGYQTVGDHMNINTTPDQVSSNGLYAASTSFQIAPECCLRIMPDEKQNSHLPDGAVYTQHHVRDSCLPQTASSQSSISKKTKHNRLKNSSRTHPHKHILHTNKSSNAKHSPPPVKSGYSVYSISEESDRKSNTHSVTPGRVTGAPVSSSKKTTTVRPHSSSIPKDAEMYAKEALFRLVSMSRLKSLVAMSRQGALTDCHSMCSVCDLRLVDHHWALETLHLYKRRTLERLISFAFLVCYLFTGAHALMRMERSFFRRLVVLVLAVISVGIQDEKEIDPWFIAFVLFGMVLVFMVIQFEPFVWWRVPRQRYRERLIREIERNLELTYRGHHTMQMIDLKDIRRKHMRRSYISNFRRNTNDTI